MMFNHLISRRDKISMQFSYNINFWHRHLLNFKFLEKNRVVDLKSIFLLFSYVCFRKNQLF